MPSLYYADEDLSLGGTPILVPTVLTDGAVGDTTTGPTEVGATDGPAGVACGASLSAIAIQSALWDGEALYAITGISVTGKGRVTTDGFGSSCIDPPPTESSSVASYIYSSLTALPGSWTLRQTDSMTAGVFETKTYALPFTARYVLRVLVTTHATTNSTNGIQSYAQNTDLRVTGTIVQIEDVDWEDEEEESNGDRCDISLSWTEAANTTAYDLERARPSSDFESLYSGAETSCTDTTAQKGQDYYYRVRARSGTLVGEWSETLVLSNVCMAHWETLPLPDTPASAMGRRCRPDESTWRKR